MEAFNWYSLLGYLPADLESSARTFKAFERPRAIPDAKTLLRLVLLYAATSLSFRSVVAWANASGIAALSDVALIDRMQNCLPWLSHLVNQLLAKEVEALPTQRPVELLDATVLQGAGGQWRLHVAYNPAQQAIRQLHLTPHTTGETLKNFTATPGTLYIADRAYGHLKTAQPFIAEGAHLLCRVKGAAWLQWADPTQVVEHAVSGGRIIIAPIPTDKRYKSQQRLEARARRKGQQLQAATRQAADYLFLFCSDPSVPAQEAVALYRLRWQIELLFKRLKSLQQLGKSRLKSEALFQVELWGQLLVSLVVEALGRGKGASLFPPEAVEATVCLAIVAIPFEQDSGGVVPVVA